MLFLFNIFIVWSLHGLMAGVAWAFVLATCFSLKEFILTPPKTAADFQRVQNTMNEMQMVRIIKKRRKNNARKSKRSR